MKGLCVGNERVSLPLFILQYLKDHAVLCCKDNDSLMKISRN